MTTDTSDTMADTRTTGSRWSTLFQADLALAMLVTIAALLATLGSAPLIIRLPLVVVLVLFMPGYAVLAALMTAPGLAVLERSLISVAASIAITVLAGLVMGVLKVPLNAINWVSALSLVSLVGLVMAWIFRAVRGVTGPSLQIPGMPFRHTLMALIAVLLVANVALAGRLIASDQIGPPPVQLWMLDGANPLTATLGVRAGGDGGDYIIKVTAGDQPIEQYDLTLDPSEVWETTLTFTEEDRTKSVVARLYESGGEAEIRYVVLEPMIFDTPTDGS